MPEPAEADAYTLQDTEDRVIFVLPWLDKRFLIVGTTEVPERGDPGAAACSLQEQAYLLDAYNRYFAPPDGAVTDANVVWTFAGVRALQDDGAVKPSRLTRRPALASIANGTGGFITLYGGKLTTHRAFAEDVSRYAARPRRKDEWPLDQGRSALWRLRDARWSSLACRARPATSRAKPAIAGPSPMAIRSKGFTQMSARSESRAGDRPRRAAG
jgi:glycerol-3-phosphate dehydrogenase